MVMQSPRTSFALLHLPLCIAPPWISVGWAKVLLYASGGDWNDVWSESLTWKHWEMELVLWHLQDGMVSKSGFCWRTHWNIRNKTLEIRWTNPAAIKMNSSTVLCVAGYGACDVAYLLWDQIATNVVEERVEGLPIRSNALLTCGKHQSTFWQWQNSSTR